MQHEQLDDVTRDHLIALINANFAGRDDLYAMASTLSSKTLSMICRRLADDLANNGIELQQIALGAGIDDIDVSEFGSQLQAELIEMIKQSEGDNAVLEEAEECEQLVERVYDDALAGAAESAIGDVLKQQREVVDFGKNVVHELRSGDAGADS